MGGVITSRIIVQRLSSYQWLVRSRILDDKPLHVVARLLYALKESIIDLKKSYQLLKEPPSPSNRANPRYFPFVSSFHDAGKRVQFIYEALERGPRCVTFKAIREDSKDSIVVKFVRSYGKEAHKWMAERGMAPRLIAFEELGSGHDDFNMVVMDYVCGSTLYALYPPPGELPLDVRCSIERALEILADGGFVYGDLRRPNIMLADGHGPIDSLIRFVDFDWAGEEGPDLLYPCFLSPVI